MRSYGSYRKNTDSELIKKYPRLKESAFTAKDILYTSVLPWTAFRAHRVLTWRQQTMRRWH